VAGAVFGVTEVRKIEKMFSSHFSLLTLFSSAFYGSIDNRGKMFSFHFLLFTFLLQHVSVFIKPVFTRLDRYLRKTGFSATRDHGDTFPCNEGDLVIKVASGLS